MTSRSKGIVFASVSAFLLTACGSASKSTVEEFYRAAEKGEVSKMVALVNMDSPQMQMMGGKVKVAMEQASKEISSSGIKDLEVKCDDKAEYATCTVDMTLKNGKKSNGQKMSLVKNKEGKWLINLGG
jgi:hypothetical protein